MSTNTFPLQAHTSLTESISPAEPRITPRERQVLLELTKGRTNKEIAKALGVSQYTVRDYITGLLAKFSVSNRVELCVSALALIGGTSTSTSQCADSPPLHS